MRRRCASRQISYRAHNGVRTAATVVVPARYGRGRPSPPLPLVISPHGRGLTGRQNARLWGRLPAVGGFAVVSPDGQGRVLPRHSWGFAGQISDLARMPSIVRRAVPWLRIDRRRIYAFGGSMGGQETLLLVARHPRLLAGAAAFDPVTDFAQQYRSWPGVGCNSLCRHRLNGGRLGWRLQYLARREVGGTLTTTPGAFARRSPAAYARRIAWSCVPLQLWWSVSDRVVRNEQRQSAALLRRVRAINIHAPVHAFVGSWIHTAAMRASTRLPLALATFDLHPWVDVPIGLTIEDPPPDVDRCGEIARAR